MLKPNLVEAIPPPVTTPVDMVESLGVLLRRRFPGRRIILAEGSGAIHYGTWKAFQELGYTEAAQRLGLELLDLNEEECVRLERPGLVRWPEIWLPRIALDSFLISLPVLKVHTLAGVTLGMKNLVGLLPPSRYQEPGHWKKSACHHRIQEAVFELNLYRAPDFVILDAREGMAESHLRGRRLEPAPGEILAAWDPVAADAYGAELLGRDWREIGHIRMGHRVLGTAEPLRAADVG